MGNLKGEDARVNVKSFSTRQRLPSSLDLPTVPTLDEVFVLPTRTDMQHLVQHCQEQAKRFHDPKLKLANGEWNWDEILKEWELSDDDDETSLEFQEMLKRRPPPPPRKPPMPYVEIDDLPAPRPKRSATQRVCVRRHRAARTAANGNTSGSPKSKSPGSRLPTSGHNVGTPMSRLFRYPTPPNVRK
ncbi:hypothetical protein DFP72DRAFT_1082802 [Ephemerocybe angulata]|uniref:Uncharacterized protein n=1 Tax=Ephemerocybe angulata TaxID=980116 RepID=A0A8H6LSE3_9AGAR|nr:hypothetical protein DFP72DRAFT_1082802 [Tulosesus angulatus]